MKRHVRSCAVAALAVFALIGATTTSFAGIVYTVTNYAAGQNGWTVNGTISVSGTGTFIGQGAGANGITAWDITASKDQVTVRTSSAFGDAYSQSGGSLTATASQLIVNPLSFLQLSSGAFLYDTLAWSTPGIDDDFGSPFHREGQYSGPQLEGPAWQTNAFSPSVGDTWIIGTAPVPEIDPATGGSALSLVAGVLAMIEQRRRRATLVVRSSGLVACRKSGGTSLFFPGVIALSLVLNRVACGLRVVSAMLLSLLLTSQAAAGLLQITGVYQDTQSSYQPPMDHFPPFDRGSVTTIHNFTVTPFTAQLQSYSEVAVTISAPAGQKFVFHVPSGLGPITFVPQFYFDGGGSRQNIFEGQTFLTFQGLSGVAPTLAAVQSDVSRVADTGSFFAVESAYKYSSEFSFQSMTISAIFAAGGWDTKVYSPWDARIIANVSADSDVGPLSELRDAPVPEIDPATGGSALSLVAGVLAMIEQRRRRATIVVRSTGF
jgi:hypothetical protein